MADKPELEGEDGPAYSFVPKLRMREGRRDMRDLLIAQQIRRIDELEHEVDRLRRPIGVQGNGGNGGDVGNGDDGHSHGHGEDCKRHAGGTVFGGSTSC